MKVNELLNEGPLDYLRGLGSHVGQKVAANLADRGRKIMEPIKAAHAAGQAASTQGEVEKLVKQLGSITLQLHKLQQPAQTNEGVFDYMRGAGGAAKNAIGQAGRSIGRSASQAGAAVGNAARTAGNAALGAAGQVGRSAQQAGSAIAGAAQNIHQQGQQASLQAQVQKLSGQRSQVLQQLVRLADKVGPDAVVKVMGRMYAQRQINLYNKLKKEFLQALQQTR